MLIQFTRSNGVLVYISGGHVEEVSPSGTGSSLLMTNGTVLTITQSPAVAAAAINNSFTTFLTTNTPTGGTPA